MQALSANFSHSMLDAQLFWSSLGPRDMGLGAITARVASSTVSRSGVKDVSSFALLNLLYALSVSERGRNYIRQQLHHFRPVPKASILNSKVELRRITCDHHLPEGAADLRTLSELPHFTMGKSDTEVSLWFSALLRAQTQPNHIRELGLKIGEGNSAAELSALSLNVWGLPEVFGSVGQDRRRLERVGVEINNLRTDIVCLQEAWGAARNVILEQIRYPYLCLAEQRAGVLGCSGLVTLSRYPIIESTFVPFSCKPGFEWFARKGVLFSRIRMPHGRIVDLYNVHLLSEPERLQRLLLSKSQADQAREQQLAQMLQIIERTRASNSTALLIGDFNIPEDHPHYATMRESFGLDIYRKRVGPQDFELIRSEKERERISGFTFDPQRNPFAARHHHNRERLDYAWLKSSSKQRIAFRSARTFVEDPISDHYGVTISLSWLK